jgi:hypothetical protein
MPTQSDDSLAALAVTAAYADLSDAEALWGVTMVEMGKTVKLFTKLYGRALSLMQREESIIRKLRKYRIYIPRSGKVTPRSIRKMAASTVPAVALLASEWLEIRYGWRPLIGEVQNTIEALKAVNSRFERVRITASRFDGSPDPKITEPFVRTKAGNDWYAQLRIRSVAYKRATAGLIVQPSSRKISASSLFGGEELLASVWELVPYSFVVDWFLNTGDYFMSWQPRLSLKVLGSWVTIEEVHENELELIGGKHNRYGSIVSAASGTASFSKVSRTRYANPSRPILPRLELNLSWAKGLDILALMRNLKR